VFCVYVWLLYFSVICVIYVFPQYVDKCWLGLLTCKNRLPYNLCCVGEDVKPCSIQSKVWQICWCSIKAHRIVHVSLHEKTVFCFSRVVVALFSYHFNMMLILQSHITPRTKWGNHKVNTFWCVDPLNVFRRLLSVLNLMAQCLSARDSSAVFMAVLF